MYLYTYIYIYTINIGILVYIHIKCVYCLNLINFIFVVGFHSFDFIYYTIQIQGHTGTVQVLIL